MKWKNARMARAGATMAPASLPPEFSMIRLAFVQPPVKSPIQSMVASSAVKS